MSTLQDIPTEELLKLYQPPQQEGQNLSTIPTEELLKMHKPPSSEVSTTGDVLKSAAIGVPKGVISLAGAPGDLAELGARGINYLAQSLPESIRPVPREPQAPTYGSGDITKAVEGVLGPLYEPKTSAGQWAQTAGEFLPAALAGPGGIARKVVAGAVVPALATETAGKITEGTAAEPIARALAGGITGLAASPSRALTAASAAPVEAKALEQAASNGYDAIRAQTKAIPIPKQDAEFGARMLAQYTASKNASAIRAPNVYAEIGNVAKAEDVGQLIEVRRNLRDIARTGGEDGKAAKTAIDRLDFMIEHRAPGTVAPLKNLDQDYGIAKGAQELQQKVADSALKAETTGTEGTHIRNAFRAWLMGDKANRLPDAERQALGDVVSPGIGTKALQGMSIFDPRKHPWITMASGAVTHGASLLGAPAGMGATALYNRSIRARAQDAIRAKLEQAPYNQTVNPGYQPRSYGPPRELSLRDLVRTIQAGSPLR